MNKWEINRVSTSERIFDKINNEMAQPVGIVIFGADCGLKDEVYMQCVERICNLATGYGGNGNMPLRAAGRAFSERKNVLTAMFGGASGDHQQRHQVVTALRDLGAQSVVGIYVKYEPIWLGDGKTTDDDITNQQAWALLNRPPTSDGLDYLLVVSEEKEG